MTLFTIRKINFTSGWRAAYSVYTDPDLVRRNSHLKSLRIFSLAPSVSHGREAALSPREAEYWSSRGPFYEIVLGHSGLACPASSWCPFLFQLLSMRKVCSCTILEYKFWQGELPASWWCLWKFQNDMWNFWAERTSVLYNTIRRSQVGTMESGIRNSELLSLKHNMVPSIWLLQEMLEFGSIAWCMASSAFWYWTLNITISGSSVRKPIPWPNV